jgi:hypothetical protein
MKPESRVVLCVAGVAINVCATAWGVASGGVAMWPLIFWIGIPTVIMGVLLGDAIREANE